MNKLKLGAARVARIANRAADAAFEDCPPSMRMGMLVASIVGWGFILYYALPIVILLVLGFFVVLPLIGANIGGMATLFKWSFWR